MKAEDVKITGKQNPTNKPNMLTKDDITFELDVDGKAIPQEVSIEVYDRVLDDELFMTTLELDNALTVHDSVRKVFKGMVERSNKEIAKLSVRIDDLNKLKTLTKQQQELLKTTEKSKKEQEDSLNKVSLEYDVKIETITTKIKETRKDFQELEKMRKEAIKIKTMKAVPCTVVEAHKYLRKRMYKDKEGKWVEPENEEDTTYISYLLAEKVTEPKLTVTEWDKSLPHMRLSIKEAISEISYYKRPSPKEVLIERRRGEKLKNILGDC